MLLASCGTEKRKSKEEKELKGNIEAYHYPFDDLDSLVIYRYNTKQEYEGEITKGKLFMLIEKNEDRLLKLSGFDENFKPLMYSKLAFGVDGITELERKHTLGDTKLARFKFSALPKFQWEQSSKLPAYENSTVKFADQNQIIKLNQQIEYSFDGFEDRTFSFIQERRCAKINQQTILRYYDNTSNLIAKTETKGFVLDLKGIGPAYGFVKAPNFSNEYVLVEILTGQNAKAINGKITNNRNEMVSATQ